MWLYLTEIDIKYLVVIVFWISIHISICLQVVCICTSHVCHFLTTSMHEIFLGIGIIREDRTSGTQFCTHITYRGSTRCRDGLHAIAKIFQYGIGTTLYSQNAEYL